MTTTANGVSYAARVTSYYRTDQTSAPTPGPIPLTLGTLHIICGDDPDHTVRRALLESAANGSDGPTIVGAGMRLHGAFDLAWEDWPARVGTIENPLWPGRFVIYDDAENIFGMDVANVPTAQILLRNLHEIAEWIPVAMRAQRETRRERADAPAVPAKCSVVTVAPDPLSGDHVLLSFLAEGGPRFLGRFRRDWPAGAPCPKYSLDCSGDVPRAVR